MKIDWEHLGDGVYACFDGHRFILHANSYDHLVGCIYLEAGILEGLIAMRQQLIDRIKTEAA